MKISTVCLICTRTHSTRKGDSRIGTHSTLDISSEMRSDNSLKTLIKSPISNFKFVSSNFLIHITYYLARTHSLLGAYSKLSNFQQFYFHSQSVFVFRLLMHCGLILSHLLCHGKVRGTYDRTWEFFVTPLIWLLTYLLFSSDVRNSAR